MIFRRKSKCHNMLSNMLPLLSEALNKVNGFVIIVEGLVIYDLTAIGYMDIPRLLQRLRHPKHKFIARKKWRIKKEESAQIAHTSLRVSSEEDSYFDSGCSRHMTGMKNYLVDLKAYTTSYVTFGDGARGKIRGIS